MDDLQKALNSALAFLETGQTDAAIQALVRLVQKHPKNADVNHRLGYVLYQAGKLSDGDVYFQRAADLDPQDANIFANWGTMLNQYMRTDLAEPKFVRALEIDPTLITALRGYASVCLGTKRFDDAHDFTERALQHHPDDPDALIAAGQYWRVVGDCEKSLSYTHRVFDRPTPAIVHENPRGFGLHISTLNYSDNESAEHIAKQHAQLGSFLNVLRSPKPFRNDKKSQRKIRIGYASSDFKWHSVSFFIKPILEAHDRDQFHITLFSSGIEHDETTEWFKSHCDKFVEVSGEPDAIFCKRVREEKIDILVDLSGYTSGHRLFGFAMGGAPIQVTYIGYPNTTGVPGMSYRIVDKWTDPPGSESLATEKIIRLDRCFLCYEPPADSPSVQPRPESDLVVFGSFNAIQKLSDTTLDLWAAVLLAVPNSRLELKASGLEYHRSQERIVGGLVARGVDRSRVDVLPYQKELKSALELYHRIDIALDSFPYHGTTTTCESLWMGVPVVSLIGDRHASRVGLSLLTAVGLSEFACLSADEYVGAAISIARDGGRRAQLRIQLRSMMQHSELMNATSMTEAIEESYQDMWDAWREA